MLQTIFADSDSSVVVCFLSELCETVVLRQLSLILRYDANRDVATLCALC